MTVLRGDTPRRIPLKVTRPDTPTRRTTDAPRRLRRDEPASIDTPPPAAGPRPTVHTAATGRAVVRSNESFRAFRLHEQFDAEQDRRSEEEARVRAAEDRFVDAARIYDEAARALEDVPPDLAVSVFEPERANGGEAELRAQWESQLRASLGPGDPEALDDALEDNALQLDVLGAAVFGNARGPNDAGYVEEAGAEHVYGPVIAGLAGRYPDSSFELVAVDRDHRRDANPGDLPLIARTDASGETTFYEVRPETQLALAGPTMFEQAAYESGLSDELYDAFLQHPEYAALDEGDADSTLFNLQTAAPSVVFDVVGDLPVEQQAQFMEQFAALSGSNTFGGLAQETPPPQAVLVAVSANHLASDTPPATIRSTTDIGGVEDNGKEEAVLEEHRDALYAPAFTQYSLRGDRPPLEGTDLSNEVGFALGLAPTEAPIGDGPFSLYGEEALEFIDPVVEQIESSVGTPATIETIPLMVESDFTGRPPPAPIPLFRVTGEGGEQFLIDDGGRRYDDLDDWRDNNRLPPGTITYPADLSLESNDPTRPAHVETVTENTHAVRDTFVEHALVVVDAAALIGGFALGTAAIVGTGGAASPAVAAAITYGGATLAGYTAVRAGLGLRDLSQHGQSLNPFASGEARSLWLQGAAGALGFSALGSSAASTAFANVGARSISNGFARTAIGLGFTATVADGAAIGDVVVNAAQNWDELSGAERAAVVAQVGFWGGLAGTQARSVYSSRNAVRALEDGGAALSAANPARPPVADGAWAGYDLDSVQLDFLTSNGITPDTPLYRWTDPQYLGSDGLAAGNPDSLARVGDIYDVRPQPNPYYDLLPGVVSPFGPDAPTPINATELGPTLNVSLNASVGNSTYASEGQVLVQFDAGDVIRSGGLFYPDEGALLQGVTPLIITTPEAVPFQIVE